MFRADCPARTTLKLVADTWSVVVVYGLGRGPQRYSDLRDRIGGISKKMLTQTLRRLERNHLVERRVLATAPARALADKWGGRAGSFVEVAGFAEIALIAVLYQGMDFTLARIGDALRGKSIVDCTNPVETRHFTLVTGPGRSMAADIGRATGGHVVKAFNLCQAAVWGGLDPPTFDVRRPPAGGAEPSRSVISGTPTISKRWRPS